MNNLLNKNEGQGTSNFWQCQVVLIKKNKIINMNLNHLSKDKEQRKQQLSLIIHNCRVYGVEVKKS